MSKITIILINKNIFVRIVHYREFLNQIQKNKSTKIDDFEGYIILDKKNRIIINNQLCFDIRKEIKIEDWRLVDLSLT